jgi:hypothetical protein
LFRYKILSTKQDIVLLAHQVLDALMLVFQRRFVMNVWKVLGGVACLSVLLGTGALAESGMKKEKPKSVTEQGLEQNAEPTHEGSAAKAAKEMEAEGEEKRSHSGGAAKAAKELEAEGEAKRSHSGGAAEAAEDLKEEGEKSQKDISAQSAHKDMKKKLPKKDLEQADPPVKK